MGRVLNCLTQVEMMYPDSASHVNVGLLPIGLALVIIQTLRQLMIISSF